MQEFNPLYIHPYKYNQWSRVPRGPLAVAVGGFLFGGTALATITVAGVSLATIGGFLITTAITSWALSALMPKPPEGQQGILSNRREPVGAFDIVYGRVRKGGTITFMETNGRDNKFMHYILVLAGHEVEAIDDIYINEDTVSLDSNGFVTGNQWKSKIRIKKYRGTTTQTVDPDLLSAAQSYASLNNTTTSIDSNFRGRGIAYLYVRLEYDQEVFADGIPTVTAIVRGKKVFDPRTSTTAYSDNAALCIRDYLASHYGLNSAQSPATLTSNSWIVAANVCDSIVAKADGGSEKRYTLNGVVSTANSPRNNLSDMLTSCGGSLYWAQGKWQFKAGYLPSGPYVNLTAGDLRSGISLVTKNSRKENFNAVAGVFVDAEQDWISTDYPRFKSSVFLQRDNNQENVLDMALPYTTSAAAAQRLAKMALFRSREEIVISADFSLKAVPFNVGDVVSFTFDRYGFDNKLFEVISWKLVPSGDGEVKVNLVLKETSADAYSWTAEESAILKNNTRLPVANSGLTISGLSVANRQTVQQDGSVVGEVLLAWQAATSAFIDKYDVEYKRTSDVAWSATTTSQTEIVLANVIAGVPYQFRVRAVSVGGFLGPWEQIGATLSGKNAPPGVPTSISATGIAKAIEIKWTNPVDRDLNHVEVWVNTSNDTTTRTLLGKVNGTNFIHNLEGGQQRWYWLRAVDNSGNFSAFSVSRNATALFIANSDVNLDVPQLMKDANLSPVEVLTTLPTIGNYVGRTVFLTTDNQLYSWNGTVYEKSVNATIADGSLTAAKFAQGIEPVGIITTPDLPTTKTTNTITWQGSLYTWNTTTQKYETPSFAVADESITDTKIAPDAITTPKLATNAVTAAKILAGAVTTDKLAANSITAAKIAAGAVGADQIAANAIVSSKIVVSARDNLLTDAQFREYAMGQPTWYIGEGTGSLSVADVSAFPIWSGPYALAITPDKSSGGYTGAYSPVIPISPSTDYRVDFVLESDAAAAAIIRFQFFTQNGASLGYQDVINGGGVFNVNTKWGDIVRTPPGASQGRIVFYSFNAVAANYLALGALTVRKAAGGELIVDGAITATKVSAGAITTDKIAANAITAGLIQAGAIQAAAIATGAVTADKISVNSLSAISANLGTITAGSININNNFIVDPSGAATIRSGTTGERLVITNTRIDVYDASNVLRVRMGLL